MVVAFNETCVLCYAGENTMVDGECIFMYDIGDWMCDGSTGNEGCSSCYWSQTHEKIRCEHCH